MPKFNAGGSSRARKTNLASPVKKRKLLKNEEEKRSMKKPKTKRRKTARNC